MTPGHPMKLDARTVGALGLEGKPDRIVFDDILTGLGVRVRADPSGRLRRTWITQYKVRGRTRRMTIGSVEVVAADQARAAAKKILARVALGEDPSGERHAGRRQAKLTVAAVVDQYLEAHARVIRPVTLNELRRYLTTGRYFKALHATPIEQVTRRDIAARILAIEEANGPAAAGRARAAISAMFTWAMRAGLFPGNNPVIGSYKPPSAGSRERVLTNDELRHVWRAADDAGEFGKIVKLLLLTAARRNEIGAMSWSELSVTDIWTLPGTRAKGKTDVTRPLSSAATAIIATIPRRVGRDFLFGERTRGYSSWGRGKDKIDRLAAIAPWTLHDLRRTAATGMADHGILPHVIEQVLGHRLRGAAAVYSRSGRLNEVRAALELWGRHILALSS